MTNIEKTEIYLEGYMQGIIGTEFTKEKKDIIMSHIDTILHKINMNDIESITTTKE